MLVGQEDVGPVGQLAKTIGMKFVKPKIVLTSNSVMVMPFIFDFLILCRQATNSLSLLFHFPEQTRSDPLTFRQLGGKSVKREAFKKLSLAAVLKATHSIQVPEECQITISVHFGG